MTVDSNNLPEIKADDRGPKHTEGLKEEVDGADGGATRDVTRNEKRKKEEEKEGSLRKTGNGS